MEGVHLRTQANIPQMKLFGFGKKKYIFLCVFAPVTNTELQKAIHFTWDVGTYFQ